MIIKNIATIVSLLLLITLLVIPPATAQDWTQFQNDSRNTGSHTGANVTGIGTKNVDTIVDSPIIRTGDQIVFFDSRNDVISYNVGTGEKEWMIERGRSFDQSPIVKDGNVYFSQVSNITILGWSDSSIVSIDSSGETRWESHFNAPIGSSPAISDDRLYVGVGRSLKAIDTETGEAVWSAKTGAMTGGPVPAGDEIYAASIPISQAREAMLGSPLGEKPADVDGTLYSFSRNGDINWRRPGVAVTGYPAVSDKYVYASTFDRTLSAIERSSGEVSWERSVNGAPQSPVYADGTVYVSTLNSSLYALNSSTGDIAWKKNTESIAHPPVFSGGRLYMTTRNGRFSLLNSSNGNYLRNRSFEQRISSPPTFIYGMVYLASGNDVHSFSGYPGFGRIGGEDTPSNGSEPSTGSPEGKNESDETDEDISNITENEKDNSSTNGDKDPDSGIVSIIIPLILALLFLATVFIYKSR